MLPLKLLLRTARRFGQALLARAAPEPGDQHAALDRLFRHQRALAQARQRLDKAHRHGLNLLIPPLRQDLLSQVKALQEAALQARQQLERPVCPVPDLPALVAEIRQVEAEFDELQLDWEKKALVVTTGAITLEGVALGPFAIRLSWDRLACDTGVRCFDVVALDPNPASCDGLVTHPHVKDTRLCAGDATAALSQALAQGRLADAFCLIRGVLTHYNAASPYVPLDEWSGDECHDCGCCLAEDDSHYCEDCGHDYCADCSSRCSGCGTRRCSGCLNPCAVCQESYCSACLSPSAHSDRQCRRRCFLTCGSCGVQVASDELTFQTRLCPACPAPEPPPSQEAVPPPAVPHPPGPHPEKDNVPTLEPVSTAAV